MSAVNTPLELLDEYLSGERNFSRASLGEANLALSKLVEADFSWAYFVGARLTKSQLQRTHFDWANLIGADLSQADVSNANFSWAKLAQANFNGANFQGTNLVWSSLVGADLRGALNLETADLREATYSEYTQFPKGFNPHKAGMHMVLTSGESQPFSPLA